MSTQGGYDHGHKQGDMGGYNSYEHQPNSYYQNGYADSTPAQFASQSSGYNQGYSKFEGAHQYRLNLDRKKREQRHLDLRLPLLYFAQSVDYHCFLVLFPL